MENLNEEKNEKCLYLLKDKVLNEIVGAFLLKTHEVSQHFAELANDVKSPFYGRQEDFIIYKKGVINDDDFSIVDVPAPFVNLLSEYIDSRRIEYQWTVQTLNYLPTGYFKMPKEKQEEIENDIRLAIQTYVNTHTDQFNLSGEVERLRNELKILGELNDTLNLKISSLLEENEKLKTDIINNVIVG